MPKWRLLSVDDSAPRDAGGGRGSTSVVADCRQGAWNAEFTRYVAGSGAINGV